MDYGKRFYTFDGMPLESQCMFGLCMVLCSCGSFIEFNLMLEARRFSHDWFLIHDRHVSGVSVQDHRSGVHRLLLRVHRYKTIYLEKEGVVEDVHL